MSLATLERELAAETAKIINNPKFRAKDILAWQCGNDLKAEAGETKIHLAGQYNTDVCFKSELDKRKAA